LPPGEILEGGLKGLVVEIGPEHIGEIELGVGALPEHEVADTLLSPGTDEQVGIGLVREGELTGEDGLVDLLRLQDPGFHLPGQVPSCLGDVPATPVVGSDLQHQVIVVRGQLFPFPDQLLELLREGTDITDDPQADILFLQTTDFAVERGEEELHEIECEACPSGGSCSGMFTANSMNTLCEAMGIALPGNGTVLAMTPERIAMVKKAAKRIVELAKMEESELEFSEYEEALYNVFGKEKVHKALSVLDGDALLCDVTFHEDYTNMLKMYDRLELKKRA